VSLFALALIALRLTGAEAAEDGAPAPATGNIGADGFPLPGSDDDLDLDDDLEDDAAPAQPGVPGAGQGSVGPPPEPVEDFDLGMPESDRKKRMGACFSYTIGRVQAKNEMMRQTVKEMAQAHNMKEDQAMNALLFTWMMTCYMNADESTVAEAQGKPYGTPMPTPAGNEEELFNVNPHAKQTAQQASQVQWKLLEGVLQENSPKQKPKQQQQQQQQQRGRPQAPQPEPSFFSGGTGILYALFIFACIGGIVLLVVGKANSYNQFNHGDRGSRSERKADKAARKLERKSQ